MLFIVMSFLSFNIKNHYEIIKAMDNKHRLHLIKLELYYYTRNEINDGFYTNLNYDWDNGEISVKFDCFANTVVIYLKSSDFLLNEKYRYDNECKCLIEEL